MPKEVNCQEVKRKNGARGQRGKRKEETLREGKRPQLGGGRNAKNIF